MAPAGPEKRSYMAHGLLRVSMQDGGDPSVEASPRDIMYRLPADQVLADVDASPHHLAQTDLR